MTSVAEYLGQDVRQAQTVQPIQMKSGAICPFMNAPCSKVAQGYEPVCSVRKKSGELWIVCRNRLCSSKKTVPLSDYQKDILFEIAKVLYIMKLDRKDVGVRREIPVKHSTGSYAADYIFKFNKNIVITGPHDIIVEMQGGGETTNTGELTRHIREVWAIKPGNEVLKTDFSTVGTLETNAWRRQQEQFVVKGNVAIQSGGGIAIATGTLLFDYVSARIISNIENHARGQQQPTDWNVCLVAFKESPSGIRPVNSPNAIGLEIDDSRIIYTTYANLVEALTKDNELQNDLFEGIYISL